MNSKINTVFGKAEVHSVLVSVAVIGTGNANDRGHNIVSDEPGSLTTIDNPCSYMVMLCCLDRPDDITILAHTF